MNRKTKRQIEMNGLKYEQKTDKQIKKYLPDEFLQEYKIVCRCYMYDYIVNISLCAMYDYIVNIRLCAMYDYIVNIRLCAIYDYIVNIRLCAIYDYIVSRNEKQ